MLKSFKKTFKIIMCGLMGIILSLGLFSPGLQVLANETNPYDDSSQVNYPLPKGGGLVTAQSY